MSAETSWQIAEEWALSDKALAAKYWLIEQGLAPDVAHEVALQACGDESWMNFKEE